MGEKSSEITDMEDNNCIFCREPIDRGNWQQNGLAIYATRTNIPSIIEFQRHNRMMENQQIAEDSLEYQNLCDINNNVWNLSRDGGLVFNTCNHNIHEHCFEQMKAKNYSKNY